jgi:hypothetical protein
MQGKYLEINAKETLSALLDFENEISPKIPFNCR